MSNGIGARVHPCNIVNLSPIVARVVAMHPLGTVLEELLAFCYALAGVLPQQHGCLYVAPVLIE